MSEKNNGGPGFPYQFESGISVIDYFAAKAMQSILGDKDMMNACLQISKQEKHGDPSIVVAEKAYAFARKMIAEREK